jgi:hypothetical protein
MSWLYLYTKHKQYRDPRRAVGDAIAKLDPAAADVYKLNNLTASPDDVARFISYTIQNNLMSVDDWAAVLDVPGVNPDLAASILNSPNITTDLATKILNSQNITPDQVASILNSSALDVSKAVSILNSQNITLNRVISVLTSPFITANRAQSILYAMPFNKRLVEILTSGAPNLTLGANMTFSGVNRFSVLNLNGYTYIADGNPHVIIANNIVISSTSVLAKTQTGGAGGGFAVYNFVYGAGGAGGGGLIIIVSRLDNAGAISANGADGMSSSFGVYTSSGTSGDGGPGVFALVADDQVGTGGRSNGNKNGGGGGVAYNAPGGMGGGSSIISYATYTDLVEAVKRAAIDWVLVNVFGKSPTVTAQFINVYGSGGGGGGRHSNSLDGGGGGGGGGGQVIILSVEFNNSGVVMADGGRGGSGSSGSGGGGGGGGVVYVFYKNLLSLGTLRANGGAGGPNGQPGTAGTAKAVAI